MSTSLLRIKYTAGPNQYCVIAPYGQRDIKMQRDTSDKLIVGNIQPTLSDLAEVNLPSGAKDGGSKCRRGDHNNALSVSGCDCVGSSHKNYAKIR